MTMLKLMMIICALLLGMIGIIAVICAEYWRSEYVKIKDGEEWQKK